MMALRISTRDRRATWGLPVALIDADSNAVVSLHKSLADAMRAKVLLEQVRIFARDFSAAELSELASSASLRMHGQRDFERLPFSKFKDLVLALRTELGRKD